MSRRVLSVLSFITVFFAFVACSNESENTVSDVERVFESANMDYFVIQQTDSETVLTGLSDSGKKQENLVIPSGCKITGQINEGVVKNVRFEKDDDVDICYLLSSSSSLETVVLPAKITTLRSYAMANCPALKTIELPEEITVVPSMCFSYDSSLESVIFKGQITQIDAQAFRMCTSLKAIEFPDTVTTIGDQAFFGCSSLTTITLPRDLKHVGSSAFSNQNSGITTIIVPKDLELETWDPTAFVQLYVHYTVKVKKGSWADKHFDEVFQGQVTKKYY